MPGYFPANHGSRLQHSDQCGFATEAAWNSSSAGKDNSLSVGEHYRKPSEVRAMQLPLTSEVQADGLAVSVAGPMLRESLLGLLFAQP
ncbi:hypothetical protein D3C74_471060 [compost metagenome]